jgi:transcriptional regulator with XRE-family HTH domain
MKQCFELLRRRRLANLTQGQLAERAGVNISTVVRLERGLHRMRPETETLRVLARALETTPQDLFPELPQITADRDNSSAA